MPRRLINDAHEWINEIPTVPNCHLAKPQPRERAWQNKRGKEDPVELDSSLILSSDLWGREYVGVTQVTIVKYHDL